MATLLDDALVTDTLLSLPGWEGDARGISRVVHLDAEGDAELRRQVEVDAASMGHRPVLEDADGGTRFVLRTEEAGGVTELDIAFASHISDLAHRLSGAEPGINAVRHGEPVAVVRSGESNDEDVRTEGPTIGVAGVTGGTTPRTPLPDDRGFSPEPGVSTEQTNP